MIESANNKFIFNKNCLFNMMEILFKMLYFKCNEIVVMFFFVIIRVFITKSAAGECSQSL